MVVTARETDNVERLMARTAPVPDIPPIPGMCPSVAVLAGGGDGGGGSGAGAGDSNGDNNAGGSGSGEGAEGDQRGAPDYTQYPECGYASHPVDVVTGRAFTHPDVEFSLPGPLPLSFSRMYSSKAAARDMGLGYGWAHTFGWEVEVRRRSVVVWNEQGIAVDFPPLRVGEETIGPWGWVLRRETWGYAVDADDGVWHLFSEAVSGGRLKLTAITDRNKNRIALTYEDGVLAKVIDSAGRQIRFDSTREGRIAAIHVKDSEQQWVTFASYTYDSEGNLVAARDADGGAVRFAYDERHRMTMDCDRIGLTFHFRYDETGRCIESWGDYPGGVDPSLHADVPAYLADGVTRAKGIHHCKFEYFDNGYSEVADSTQVRRYFGNRHGTLDKSVEGGRVLSCSYDGDGHLLTRTDALGATVGFVRDRRGRIVQIMDALGRSTTIDRQEYGLPVSIVHPDGSALSFVRDRCGNPILVTDEAGATSSYQYDERGLCTALVGSNGARTTFVYDEQGNQIAVVLADGATWHYRYDGLGRLIDGNLIEVMAFDGRVLKYGYDPNRRLQRFENGKREKTLIQYNLAGERVSVEHADGTAVAFEYDARGRLLVARGDESEVRFERDPRGDVIRDTQVLRGEEHSVEIEYDAQAMRVARRTSLGHAETIVRDMFGERARTTLPGGRDVEHQRDVFGREVTRFLPRSGRIESTFDAAGRLSLRRTRNGAASLAVGANQPEWIGERDQGITASARYQYDLAGELQSAWNSRSGERTYTYDPVGQLLSCVPEHARAEVFRYDAAGNVYEGGAESREYGPGNRLLRKGASKFRWDDDGNLIEKSTLAAESGKEAVSTYRWTASGLLASVQGPDGRRVEFDYDPLLRRVAKRVYRTAGGRKPELAATTRFVWDANVLVHELTTRAQAAGDPVVSQRTYWFEDDGFDPVAHADSSPMAGEGERWYFYVNDPAGTPERLVESSGEVACELTRTAFGVLVASPGARTTTPLRLEGQYADDETGLSYNRYRYYDPDLGRFLSADPMALSVGTNFYAFGLNPIGWTDPFGLDWNYRLSDESGKVYYHGRASTGTTEAQVMYRHSKNEGMKDGVPHTRFGATDTLERINDNVTRDEAMGIEHAAIKQGRTHTCLRATKTTKGTTDVRGNTDKGIGKAKLKTKKGKARKKAGKDKLNGQNPNTMTPKSRWQRDADGNAEKFP